MYKKKLKNIEKEQERVGKLTVKFMEVEDQRRWYIKRANNEITDDEYNKFFLEENNIKDLDNIDKWSDAEFYKLIANLNEIMKDGAAAKNELNTTIEEENMLPLYDRMRYGVIAAVVGKTAEANRKKNFG